MHIGRRYRLLQTLSWSRRNFLLPLVWSIAATAAYDLGKLTFLGIPTLPMSLIGIAVAFYLGFKNNASYDRLWEARKIYGAIVNASRSWAYGTRDLIGNAYEGEFTADELDAIRTEMVRRHVAWMDALRHQLRRIKSWEHTGPTVDRLRNAMVPELKEDLKEVLAPNLSKSEREAALATINPAAHLIGFQSRRLAELRAGKVIDGFAHLHLQELLQELMTQQGKAERIKNFPFPRQYATVNTFFAATFAFLVPFGLLPEFAKLAGVVEWQYLIWLTVPFATVVSWVFLTTDQIGDWSENPFEGLANDVPITSMSRGIERDILQMVGETELLPPRQPDGMISM
ncbi:MAG: bestrophin family ion channel [Myxococcota bacterium]